IISLHLRMKSAFCEKSHSLATSLSAKFFVPTCCFLHFCHFQPHYFRSSITYTSAIPLCCQRPMIRFIRAHHSSVVYHGSTLPSLLRCSLLLADDRHLLGQILNHSDQLATRVAKSTLKR
uniref:Uncharacterized protein n=1 Tax=Parascaris univalens TaxID=6257 RepID=A0A915A3L2_PARUN